MSDLTPTQIGNRNKARGIRAERTIASSLQKDGYTVIRAAGSLGPADLIAMKPRELLLIQVKTEPRIGRKAQISPAEWNQLIDYANNCGAKPIIAIKGYRTTSLYLITGRKERPTRTPPWQPWTADQLA